MLNAARSRFNPMTNARSPSPLRIASAVAAVGASAVVTQLTLMREMLAAFGGNELILGVLLGNWLLLTGVGAWLGRVPSAKFQGPNQESPGTSPGPAGVGLLIGGLILLAVLPIGQVVMLRLLRDVLFIRGAAAGPISIVVSSAALLLPYCLVSGFLLTLGGAMLSGAEEVTPPHTDRGWYIPVRPVLPLPYEGEGRGEGGSRRTLGPQSTTLTLPSPWQGEGFQTRGIGWSYLADTVGSIIGGVAFTFLLVGALDHLAILLLAAAVNLLAGAAVAWQPGTRRISRAIAAVAAPAIVGVFCYLLLGPLADLDRWTVQRQYQGGGYEGGPADSREGGGRQVVFVGNSPYGRLVVTRDGQQINFMQNGVPVLSSDDLVHAETMVHFAMVQRLENILKTKPDDPFAKTQADGTVGKTQAGLEVIPARQVLLISGGLSGTARQAIKYPGTEVVYVELDPLIVSAGQRFLPNALNDSRIHVVNADGRQFIRQISGQLSVGSGQSSGSFTDHRPLATGHGFDVVIVDLPEPETAALNRFHTRQFYQEVRRILTPGGVLCFAMGPDNEHFSESEARALACDYRTARECFPYVRAIPGEKITCLASDQPLHLDLADRIAAAGLKDIFYVNHDHLDDWLRPDRFERLAAVLQEGGPPGELGQTANEAAAIQAVGINEDFHPRLYFYRLRHWASQFPLDYALLEAVLGVGLAGCLMYLLLAGARGRKRNSGKCKIQNEKCKMANEDGGNARPKREDNARSFSSAFRNPNSELHSNSEIRNPKSEISSNSEFRIPNSEFVTLAIFASGFAASALEIVLLLGLQILCGSLYHQLGLIVTVFMAGLATGAWLANAGSRVTTPPRPGSRIATGPPLPTLPPGGGYRGRAALAGVQLAITGFAVLLPAALVLLNRLGSNVIGPMAVQAAIAALTFVLAGLVGMQFPLAAAMGNSECGIRNSELKKEGASENSKSEITHSEFRIPNSEFPPNSEFRIPNSFSPATVASRLYLADFVGASLGALLASTLLIPLVGVTGVCLVVAGLSGLAAVGLMAGRRIPVASC